MAEASDSIFEDFAAQQEERTRRMGTNDGRLHAAILREDIEAVKTLLAGDLSSDEINARDRRGNPPLHIATHLQNEEIITILLEAGADVTWKNGGGWSVVQEAITGRNLNIMKCLLMETKEELHHKFEERIPQAIRELQLLPDFYMELDWAFRSWIPLVSSFCPSDNYKIWKKGSCIRVDTTLIGYENLKWKRGQISFLFSEKLLDHPGEEEEAMSSHVAIINHQTKRVEFALESFKRYSLGNSESEKKDLKLLANEPVTRMQITYNDISYSPYKTWLGSIKREDVGEWKNCKLYEVSGIQRKTIKRVHKKRSESPATEKERNIKIEEYEQGPLSKVNPKGEGLLHSYEDTITSTKSHKGKIWISQDFPVALQDLLPIFAILSPNGKHFEKLKEFLSLSLPGNGFPVKLEIPVFPTVYGTASFGTFMNNPAIEDSIFSIPQEYKILKNRSMIFHRRVPAKHPVKPNSSTISPKISGKTEKDPKLLHKE